MEQAVDQEVGAAAVDQEAAANPLGDAARILIDEADGLARVLEVINFGVGLNSILWFLTQ